MSRLKYIQFWFADKLIELVHYLAYLVVDNDVDDYQLASEPESTLFTKREYLILNNDIAQCAYT